jgi:hypothetical protein
MDYDAPGTSKEDLLDIEVLVRAPNRQDIHRRCRGLGPHGDTGRIADLSPGLMTALGITTDDEVEVVFPFQQGDTATMPYDKVAISSGHGLLVRGASGVR